jgi:hypothetical protein
MEVQRDYTKLVKDTHKVTVDPRLQAEVQVLSVEFPPFELALNTVVIVL